MESHQESTIVHILRAGVLLLALIAVPGTAVCWNLFSKDFWSVEAVSPIKAPQVASTSTQHTATETIPTKNDLSEHNSYHSLDARDLPKPASASFPSPAQAVPMESAATPTSPPIVPMPRFDLPVDTADAGSIRTMGHSEGDRTAEQAIPADFAANPAVWAVGEPKMGTPPEALLPQPDGQRPLPQAPSQFSQRNFPAIERELKEMGAKYYRLEKWGSRGELFRFSCYVSPKDRHPYQKYFQAIDSDEIRVMECVLDDIRAWRGGR